MFEKGGVPFRIYSINCITKLYPGAPNGGTTFIVAICQFSKLVKVKILSILNSTDASKFLHEELVYRYGPLAFIHTNIGTELAGEFRKYWTIHGIMQ